MRTTESALIDTYAQLPISAVRGEGMYVFDAAGRRYLDLYGGHAVSLLGHTPQAVADAIYRQAGRLFFYSNVLPLAEREEAARTLVNFSGSPEARVFFCNSGAEANENALKLAIKKTGRKKLVGYKGSFHGRTLLAAAVTDHPDWHAFLGPWVHAVKHLVPNDLAELSAIDKETAAVILEPIQSMAGVLEFDRNYLSALRARCDETGALLIFDEVQTGMGRTGVPFISGTCGVRADMLTTAKGLGSGFPVGALILEPRVWREVRLGDLGSTFGGGPLAAAAVQATLNEIESRNLLKSVEAVGEYAREVLRLPGVKAVRGAGALLGLVLEAEAKCVQTRLLEHGIITGTSGDKHTLRLLPPLIVEREHIDQLRTALRDVLCH